MDLDGQANSSRTFAETFTGLLASKLFTAESGTLTEVPQAVSKHLILTLSKRLGNYIFRRADRGWHDGAAGRSALAGPG